MWSDLKHMYPYFESGMCNFIYYITLVFQKVCLYTKLAIESETAKSIALNSLWLYSKTCIYIDNFSQYCYKNNENIKFIADNATSIYEQINDFLSRKKKEPIAEYWISLCTVQNYDRSENHYVETIQLYEEPIIERDILEFTKNVGIVTNNIRNTIVVVKSGGFYKIHINDPDDDIVEVSSTGSTGSTCSEVVEIMKKNAEDDCDDENKSNNDCSDANVTKSFEIEPSCFRIMSINYFHPDMNDPIELKIPKEMLLVKNQLFSPAFVRRCLEYQNYRFAFDTRYSVEIIDANVNIFTLKHNQYLQINENNATICLL
jgi:hypothetical protein